MHTPRRNGRPPQTAEEYHVHGLRDLARHATDPSVRWTLWREVYGTFLGVLPFLLLALGAWMNMSERVRVAEVQIVANKQTHDIEINNIKQSLDSAAKQAERDRMELMATLGRISAQIETLQKDVAGHSKSGR